MILFKMFVSTFISVCIAISTLAFSDIVAAEEQVKVTFHSFYIRYDSWQELESIDMIVILEDTDVPFQCPVDRRYWRVSS